MAHCARSLPVPRCLAKKSGWWNCQLSRAKTSGLKDEVLGSIPTAESGKINQISLSDSVPWLPRPVYASSSVEQQKETKVTTLDNGLRVASELKFGKFCTIGVVIDSGSRYEVAYPSGVSHFLEKLAFGATQKYDSKDAIMQTLEKHGGICDCQSSRDTFIYAASAESSSLDSVLQILADVCLRPSLRNEEVEATRLTIQFELEDLDMSPQKDTQLMEMIHAAAYRDNTLGLPKTCPSENVGRISRSLLYTYLKHHYTPDRMVVAGVGVEHETLVESVQRYFVEEAAVWDEQPDLLLPRKDIEVDHSYAQYTGGEVQVERDLSNVSLGPTPMPELAHVVVGLESCSHQSDDFIAFCILNMLMGGGSSFSAGGPGKGMYTRLYTNVLNRHHWMFNATSYNHAYNDSGVFCIHGSAHPSQLSDMVEVIVKEFSAMTGNIGDIELQRAKKQLTSMLLMNLECRPIVFEDLGRQVLATGGRKQPQYFVDKIARIREEDIQRVASRMLRTKPSVASLGDLRRLPKYSEVEAGLLDAEGRMSRSRRFSLFR